MIPLISAQFLHEELDLKFHIHNFVGMIYLKIVRAPPPPSGGALSPEELPRLMEREIERDYWTLAKRSVERGRKSFPRDFGIPAKPSLARFE